MSSCDCAKKREWAVRRKWIIEIFDKQCREDKNCHGKTMKDSVWLSFMKDRYGHIDPKRLADVDESDLRKALAWKYKGDVLDQRSRLEHVCVFVTEM